MKCFYCNAEVRWNNDYDTEDTYPDSEHTIVSMYNCDECDTWYEVFHQKKNNLNRFEEFIKQTNDKHQRELKEVKKDNKRLALQINDLEKTIRRIQNEH